MKHDSMLAQVHVNINSMTDRNVSMEMNTLKSANKQGKSRLTFLFHLCCFTPEEPEASLTTKTNLLARICKYKLCLLRSQSTAPPSQRRLMVSSIPFSLLPLSNTLGVQTVARIYYQLRTAEQFCVS